MSERYNARLSVDITDAQAQRMARLIPHGLRKIIFSQVVDKICDRLESDGGKFIAAIIDNKLTVKFED